MVIVFKGTNRGRNNAPYALAVCAAMSAMKFGNKTAVLQFTKRYPVEKILIGKKLEESIVKSDRFMVSDTGIDSLLRRVQNDLTPENVNNASISMLKGENLFDVITVTNKEKLYGELKTKGDEVEKLFSYLSGIYDHIFVLIDGRDNDMAEFIDAFADRTVLCICQGKKEFISYEGKSPFYLIADFDKHSSYSKKYMEKMYGKKNMFIMPYNCNFKDAYNSETVLQFMVKNSDAEPSSVNHLFISEMYKLTEAIFDMGTAETPEIKFPRIDSNGEEMRRLRKLSPDAIKEKKEIRKAGFFGKKEVRYLAIEERPSDTRRRKSGIFGKWR